MQQQDSQARLKGLFRELFQLDVADLDFGLYRLFHLKRIEVETFLDKQLPAEIDRAFEAAAGAERETLQKRVAAVCSDDPRVTLTEIRPAADSDVIFILHLSFLIHH